MYIIIIRATSSWLYTGIIIIVINLLYLILYIISFINVFTNVQNCE